MALDREPFVSGAVYPNGDKPPFVVNSGFRFPAPVGNVHITLTYTNCDVASVQVSNLSDPDHSESEDRYLLMGLVAEADVQVSESLVTEVIFDGERVLSSPPRPDTAVTLERIYQAITGSDRAAP